MNDGHGPDAGRSHPQTGSAQSDAGHGRHRVLANIQALRALAAIMVVFVHLEKPLAQLGIGAEWQFFFAGGVDLFFVISGFIMVHTTARRTITPMAFLRLRIIRIVPLYWVITLCVFAVALILPSMMQGTVADTASLLKSLFFIPYARPDGLVRPILFVGWSLNLEMIFYVIFALTLVLRNAVVRVVYGIAVLVALVVVGKAFAGVHPLMGFVTDPIILQFGLGMAIGLFYPMLPAVPSGRSTTIVAAIALIAIIGWVALPPDARVAAVAIASGATVLVAVALEKLGFRLDSQPVIAVGDASYALYLIHPFVTQTAILAAAATAIITPVSAAATILIALAAAIGLAIVIHRAIERPLGRLASRWWDDGRAAKR